MDRLINIPEKSWLRGGTPNENRIVPWGVQSIGHEGIDFCRGRLETDIVNEAIAALVKELP